jgi:hypothetical protein
MLNHTSVSALLFRAQLNHLSWDVNPFPNSHGLVEKISFLNHGYIYQEGESRSDSTAQALGYRTVSWIIKSLERVPT